MVVVHVSISGFSDQRQHSKSTVRHFVHNLAFSYVVCSSAKTQFQKVGRFVRGGGCSLSRVDGTGTLPGYRSLRVAGVGLVLVHNIVCCFGVHWFFVVASL